MATRSISKTPRRTSARKNGTRKKSTAAHNRTRSGALTAFFARLEGTPLALELAGLFCIIAAGILFLALVSFSPNDSLLTSETLAPVVKNLAGGAGAWGASALYLAFGFASFGFVILIAWLGVHFISHNSPKSVALASSATVVVTALVATLLDRFLGSPDAFFRGGAIGAFLSRISAQTLGTAGSYFFIFLLLVALAVIIFKFSLKEQAIKLFAFAKQAFFSVKAGLAHKAKSTGEPSPSDSDTPREKPPRPKKVVDSVGEPPIVDRRAVGPLGHKAFPFVEKVRLREIILDDTRANAVATETGVAANVTTSSSPEIVTPVGPVVDPTTADEATEREFPILGVDPHDFGIRMPEEMTTTPDRVREADAVMTRGERADETPDFDSAIDAVDAEKRARDEIEDAIFSGALDDDTDDESLPVFDTEEQPPDAPLPVDDEAPIAITDADEPDAFPAFANEHSEIDTHVNEFNKAKPIVAYPSFIQTNYDPRMVDKKYKGFKLDLLKKSIPINDASALDAIRETASRLENTLADFNIEAKVVGVSKGPVITRYELEIAAGTRISKVVGLSDNIALALASESVRIIAPIPGRSVIGIEIPNKLRNMVFLRDVLESDDFQSSKADIPFALGKGIYGNNMVGDLAASPHLLIAGTTGSGKSVSLSTIILSILYKFRPDELKFIFIDKKRVELSIYNGVPHLMAPVVSDDKKATLVLRHIVDIMEKRYEKMEKFYVRHVKTYNEKVRDLMKQGALHFEGEALELFPYIVVVIDELHNLMVVASKEVEDLISRLAAMSRAVGIHLIIATQRPSADVVTGVIKANLPTRLSFQVPNKTNSRIIIDTGGAEQLLGKGDSLYLSTASQTPERIQGAFVSDAEVKRIVDEISSQMPPMYDETVIEMLERDESDAGEDDYAEAAINDELWKEAIRVVVATKKASASYLQRRLKIGYNRAARIIEIMEQRGIIGPENGSKPREVLAVGDTYG